MYCGLHLCQPWTLIHNRVCLPPDIAVPVPYVNLLSLRPLGTCLLSSLTTALEPLSSAGKGLETEEPGLVEPASLLFTTSYSQME